SRLGDFLWPRAVLQLCQRGGQVVPHRTSHPQFVLEIALVEGGNDLTGLHSVALVYGQCLDPPVNLEGQIHLADVDVPIKGQGCPCLSVRPGEGWAQLADVEEAGGPGGPADGEERERDEDDPRRPVTSGRSGGLPGGFLPGGGLAGGFRGVEQ